MVGTLHRAVERDLPDDPAIRSVEGWMFRPARELPVASDAGTRSVAMSSCGSETGGKVEAIVRSDYCWRLDAATLIVDCGLLNHI